jgi:hypothetical protein
MVYPYLNSIHSFVYKGYSIQRENVPKMIKKRGYSNAIRRT